MADQLIGTRAHTLFKVLCAGRLDGQVVVTGHKGKVGVTGFKNKNHRVFAVGLELFDLIDNSFGG